MKKLIDNFTRPFISQKSKELRDKKIHILFDCIQPENFILDVGVWCRMPEPNPSENWFEKKYNTSCKIVAVGLHNMRDFHYAYPGIFCVQADGCALPFKNNSIIAAMSNAVLEHIPLDNQLLFVEELSRVVKSKALLAVPDRLSPIEIHSRVFFLHWLPDWQKGLRMAGESYWASGKDLSTIFSYKQLKRLLLKSRVSCIWEIKRQLLFTFIPVSLLALFIKKQE